MKRAKGKGPRPKNRRRPRPVFAVPTICPYCQRNNDAATPKTGTAGPRPGDTSVCYGCGRWSLFTETMSLRMPTAEETKAVRESPCWPDLKNACATVAVIRRIH